MRIDGPLSARAVLDHFNEKGRGLLGLGQEDAGVRIAQLLAHEADLSAAWGGLPGTDHPRHWQPAVGDEAAMSDRRSEHRRLDVHLPLWWALPLAVRDRQPHRVTLPLAANREALGALIRRNMPGAWWNSTVHVTLDIETRVYWGARGAVHPHAAARHACAQRGDAGSPSLKLMTLRARPRRRDGDARPPGRPRRRAEGAPGRRLAGGRADAALRARADARRAPAAEGGAVVAPRAGPGRARPRSAIATRPSRRA